KKLMKLLENLCKISDDCFHSCNGKDYHDGLPVLSWIDGEENCEEYYNGEILLEFFDGTDTSSIFLSDVTSWEITEDNNLRLNLEHGTESLTFLKVTTINIEEALKQ